MTYGSWSTFTTLLYHKCYHFHIYIYAEHFWLNKIIFTVQVRKNVNDDSRYA